MKEKKNFYIYLIIELVYNIDFFIIFCYNKIKGLFMKYQLIKPINPNYSTIEQILTNREIDINEIQHYLNTTDEDINSPMLLG